LLSVQFVLLPVFVLVGLTFALLLGMAGMRGQALKAGQTTPRDVAAGKANWPTRAAQIGDCFSNQFEVPMLFYILIALALPLRHADLVIVLLSWVFVVTRFAHAGIFVTSNDVRLRGPAWFSGVLVLFAMWIYFALRILLVF
jgi:hypothetical protein